MNRQEKYQLFERGYYWLYSQGINPTTERVKILIQFCQDNQVTLCQVEAKLKKGYYPTRSWPCRVGHEQIFYAVVNGERIFRPKSYFQELGISPKIKNNHFFIRVKPSVLERKRGY